MTIFRVWCLALPTESLVEQYVWRQLSLKVTECGVSDCVFGMTTGWHRKHISY